MDIKNYGTMARKSFNFYDCYYEPIKHFNKTDKANIIIATIEYCLYEKEPDWLNEVCKFAFDTMKPKMQFDIKQYKNGCKGGAPKGNKNAEKTTQKQPKNNPKTTQKQPKNNPKTTQKQPKNNPKTTQNLDTQPAHPQLFTDDIIVDTEDYTDEFITSTKEKRTKKENNTTLKDNIYLNIYNYIYNIYNIEGKKNFLKLKIEEREKIFYEHLIPFVREQGGEYDKEMIRDFYDYWSEINQQGTKMRWEEQATWETSKRLSMWCRKNRQYNSNGTTTFTRRTERTETETERRNREAREALLDDISKLE